MSKQGLRINEKIKAYMVRLIDESNNQAGVVDKSVALERAREVGLDLVEVAPTSDPPVCRIMDYGKWLYQQKRKVREAHKKTQHHQATLKEIRLRPETDKHDLEIKLNHAREFLEKGHKVQFTMQFRGRQLLHQEMGREMFDHIIQAIEDLAKVEQPCNISYKRMTMVIVPK